MGLPAIASWIIISASIATFSSLFQSLSVNADWPGMKTAKVIEDSEKLRRYVARADFFFL